MAPKQIYQSRSNLISKSSLANIWRRFFRFRQTLKTKGSSDNKLSRPALWSLLNNSGLDGRGLSVCWNPDCLCRRLLPKSRCLPFSGFLPLNVSSPAVGDIFKSGRCRCFRFRGSQRTATSEDDDIDSQDSNTPIDHGHLAQN